MDTTTKTVSEQLDEVYNELLSVVGLVVQIRKGEHGDTDDEKVDALYEAIRDLDTKCGDIYTFGGGAGWLYDLKKMSRGW
jgi:hypothetical protein